MLFLTAFSVSALAQLPVISYSQSSRVYTVGTAVTGGTPVNTGVAVVASGQTATYNVTEVSTDAPPTAVAFNQPLGATIDKQGNIYVAEAGSHIIRKITPDGNVSLFAGSFYSGYADDQGPMATFYHPVGLATDSSGNLYVADEDNNVIRKITAAGLVSTFAGSTTQGDAVGDRLTGARFKFPCGIAVAASGNLPLSLKPIISGMNIVTGWPSIAASASIPPTPQPSTPKPLIIVVWLSVPTRVSG